MTLREWTAKITPPDAAAMEEARRRQAQLAKPPAVSGGSKTSPCSSRGSPGACITRSKKSIFSFFAADNGVVDEGVFERAALRNTLADDQPYARQDRRGDALQAFRLRDHRLRRRCRSEHPRKGGAMPQDRLRHEEYRPRQRHDAEECERAVLTGIELAAETDADVLGVGEMGIGNTTTSSAVLAVLLDAPVETVTGRGGGVTDEAFTRKKAVIQKPLRSMRRTETTLDVLAKVGGFDLAAMCGAFLGAAATRRPVVIDGLISAVAGALRLPDLPGRARVSCAEPRLL